MTAKAIVTTQPPPPPPRTYPWVGISLTAGVIVWFTGPFQGVVVGRDRDAPRSVGPGSGSFDIGSTAHTWHAENFVTFTGTVTISN